MKKFLIVAGVHGDEPHALAVLTELKKVKKLLASRQVMVELLIANPKAVSVNKRFLETDLNRSFKIVKDNVSAKVLKNYSFEEKLALKLSKKISEYDYVIDFHNTLAAGTDCVISTCPATDFHKKLARALGFNKLVIMPPSDALISLNPKNSLSIEVSEQTAMSAEKFSAKVLANKLLEFVANYTDDVSKSVNPETYRFVSQVKFKSARDVKKIKNFKKLTKADLAKYSLPPNSYPIFLGGRHNKKGMIIVEKLSN